jgi:hypothetical protein
MIPFVAAKKMHQGCYPNPYSLPFYQQKDLLFLDFIASC